MLNYDNLRFDEASRTWRLKEHKSIAYSDGGRTERVLEQAFTSAGDLSSNSYELESWIQDWPTEYHLSRKRAQLVQALNFPRELTVLEVGAGCGAITRPLAERFDHVISIEGNATRARLARLRTEGLDNVVVSAPFQDVGLASPVDLLYCIGVLEYSGAFIEGEADPYRSALEKFASLLSPGGRLVLAIENKFGLRYWQGLPEDHTQGRFDGLEGYLRRPGTAETFGYHGLRERLAEFFPHVEFFFPFPDYKMPRCVVSEELMQHPAVGELMGQLRARDYFERTPKRNARRPDRRFVAPELTADGLAHYLADSFLVVAGKAEAPAGPSAALATLYSEGRRPDFQTVTTITREHQGPLMVTKELQSGLGGYDEGRLQNRKTEELLVPGETLQLLGLRAMARAGFHIDDLVPVVRRWVEFLAASFDARPDAGGLPGSAIDCVPKNLVVDRDHGLHYIDREWEWSEPVSNKLVLIRGLFYLLGESHDDGGAIGWRPTRSLRYYITRLSRAAGIDLTGGDFARFYRVEEEIRAVVYGSAHASVRFWTECPSPHALRRGLLWARYVAALPGRVMGRLLRR